MCLEHFSLSGMIKNAKNLKHLSQTKIMRHIQTKVSLELIPEQNGENKLIIVLNVNFLVIFTKGGGHLYAFYICLSPSPLFLCVQSTALQFCSFPKVSFVRLVKLNKKATNCKTTTWDCIQMNRSKACDNKARDINYLGGGDNLIDRNRMLR